jgi:Receptor L domain
MHFLPVRPAYSMQIAVGTFYLFFLNFLEISVQFSYDLEARFLYELNNGCKNVDIRFDVDYFEVLQNCITVHGYLRISDLMINETRDKISFPDLREITGYLLITNVIGLTSVGKIFPNLTEIGGDVLFNDYAIVIRNNIGLERVGLKSLMYVGNGGLVSIQNTLEICRREHVSEPFPKPFDPNRFSNVKFY